MFPDPFLPRFSAVSIFIGKCRSEFLQKMRWSLVRVRAIFAVLYGTITAAYPHVGGCVAGRAVAELMNLVAAKLAFRGQY